MSKPITIAIDGWSSCGKSTLARQLAQKLGYLYVDSGAMYRAITLYLMRNRVNLDDIESVERCLPEIRLDFAFNPDRGASDMILNGENVESEIRNLDVAARVSVVAAISKVREIAVARQRALGKAGGVVMDGRDIGSVVFPQAELKIFMTASPEVRAQRRLKELLEKYRQITLSEVRENLAQRDHIDSTRAVSPLIQCPDARILDNSDLNLEEQLELAVSWVLKIRS
ncbi:MAG: (d)CMP kinase [Bacteroidota bacterium]